MPQNNIYILCTRTLEPFLITRAAEKNIFIDAIPFIKTEPLAAGEIEKLVSDVKHEKKFAAFTSSIAVEAIAAQIDKNINWKIYCTGGITKEAVKKYFGSNSIEGSAKNASMIADKIIAEKKVKEIIFFCGDQRMNDLPQRLLNDGITVKEIIVYNTILKPQVIDKNYDGILFFSPSAVHSFFSENTIVGNVILFAIGNTTATTIKTYCINKILISEWPGAENLIALAIDYFENNR